MEHDPTKKFISVENSDVVAAILTTGIMQIAQPPEKARDKKYNGCAEYAIEIFKEVKNNLESGCCGLVKPDK